MATAAPHRMTVNEFLDHLGGEVEERLELIDGVITGMVGGTLGAGVLADLMIAQDGYRVEVYSREQGGRWVYEAHEDFELPIALPRLGIELSLGEIYEGFEPVASEAAPSTVEQP